MYISALQWCPAWQSTCCVNVNVIAFCQWFNKLIFFFFYYTSTVVAGPTGCGKSAWVLRLIDNSWEMTMQMTSVYGNGRLQIVEGNINQDQYKTMLEKRLLPQLNERASRRCFFFWRRGSHIHARWCSMPMLWVISRWSGESLQKINVRNIGKFNSVPQSLLISLCFYAKSTILDVPILSKTRLSF